MNVLAEDILLEKDSKFRALCEEAGARSDEIEKARALPKEFAQKLARADLLAMFAPKSIEGAQYDPLHAAAHLLALARYDAASAWVAMIGSTACFGAGYLPHATSKALLAPDKITCGIFAPNGTATPADDTSDDYIVNGRWSWASGSANADTIGLGCRVEEGVRLVIVPRAQIIFHDTWHSLGLCGSSSGDVELKDARVPKAHSYSIMEAVREEAPLYKMPYFGLLASGVAAVALGNAWGALSAFDELAGAKRAAGTKRVLGARSRIQGAFAHAHGLWGGARHYYWHTLSQIWQKAQSPNAIDYKDKAALRLASTHAMRASLEVLRIIHDLAGGTAVYDESRLQRHLRDGETASQHMITGSATYDMVGRVMLLGDDPALQL